MSSSYEMGEHFPSRDAGTLTSLPDVTVIWVPCGWCWSQRREFIQTDEGWHWRPCTRCMGIGSIPIRSS
jgi:hypothetical protein